MLCCLKAIKERNKKTGSVRQSKQEYDGNTIGNLSAEDKHTHRPVEEHLFQIRSGHITKYTPPHTPIPAFMFLQMPSQAKTATAVPVLAHIPNT